MFFKMRIEKKTTKTRGCLHFLPSLCVCFFHFPIWVSRIKHFFKLGEGVLQIKVSGYLNCWSKNSPDGIWFCFVLVFVVFSLNFFNWIPVFGAHFHYFSIAIVQKVAKHEKSVASTHKIFPFCISFGCCIRSQSYYSCSSSFCSISFQAIFYLAGFSACIPSHHILSYSEWGIQCCANACACVCVCGVSIERLYIR